MTLSNLSLATSNPHDQTLATSLLKVGSSSFQFFGEVGESTVRLQHIHNSHLAWVAPQNQSRRAGKSGAVGKLLECGVSNDCERRRSLPYD